jgi:protein-tyrosine-phosphatase
MGVDLGGHRARRFGQLTLQVSDLVLTFEPGHAIYLASDWDHAVGAQLTVIGLFATRPFAYLHDPYGASKAYFRASFRRIDEAIAGLAAKLPDASKRLQGIK